MKKQNSYFTLLLGLFLCVTAPVLTWAVPTITLNSEVDLDYGLIEYNAAATGSVSLATNGNLTYSGGFSGDPLGTAGQFLITLTNAGGNLISIGCDSTAIMTDGSGNSVNIDSIEYVRGSGNRTSFGGGTACNGTGSPVLNINLTGGTANRTIYIGARLNISSPISASGQYSTANAGGNPITFVVNFM